MGAIPAETFGTSLLLDNGDLSLQDGDLALVSGRDNFGQALRVIIETPFGSDPVNVNYGFDLSGIFVAGNTVTAIKDIIRLNIVKSLSQDNRVGSISEIVFDDEPDFATLAPDLAGGDPGTLARHSRQWHAVVSFTTVAGDAQSILLSGASAR